MSSAVQLIGGCKTGWTRTNDGNTLSTPYFWRLTVHIALLVSIFDKAPLIFLRADWISVDITGTCCLAECRADTACKFREVIRLGETLIRHLHISCIHIIIPLRHEVIQRTTGRHTGNHLAILAKRHTTVHTTCRLFALFFHRKRLVKLVKILYTLKRWYFLAGLSFILHKSCTFSHKSYAPLS